MTEHIPVMLNEVLGAMKPWEKQTTVIDATLGLGGHTGAILKNCRGASVIGFDQDPDARAIAGENLKAFAGRFEIIADNFRNIDTLSFRQDFAADTVLFDLGVSNLQLTEAERGFSFQEDGPLDMRMDRGVGIESELTAEDIINSWSIKELTEIFREYGEERFAYQIARGIVRAREHGQFVHTTFELVELIRAILPEPVQRKMGGHPARRVFQALRIAVNHELDALSEALDAAFKVTANGGKIIVISYHSLEDRMVKKRFRSWKEQNLGELNPRKALVPADREIEMNKKSRSAKLRVFEKMRQEG